MNTEFVRERLRLMAGLIAEILSMLPEEPTGRPHLVLVKDDDNDDLPITTKPSRAREGFPIISTGNEILQFPLPPSQGRGADYTARRGMSRGIEFPEENHFGVVSGEDQKKQSSLIEEVKEEEKSVAQKNKKAVTAPKSAFYFSKKEIAKMPIEFQKIFTIQLPVHVRMKANGVYEARFRKYGYNIAVSSVRYEDLKGRFLAALWSRTPTSAEGSDAGAAETKSEPYFWEVSERWLDLKRPTIKANTFKYYEGLFAANLLPVLGDRRIGEIRQSDVQDLINRYTSQEKWRTATKIWQTLTSVFNFAIGEDLLEKSPMRMLRPPKYEEQGGRALTLDEEREFLSRLSASRCAEEIKDALLFLLYSGIRRSELASVRFEEGFVSVSCAKMRKGYREKRRLIPVTPMLARHLPPDFDALRTVRPDALTQAFKRLMPEHHLHELRHTYITRCQECGVAREVVSVWAGHAADNTQTTTVYTHFSREFMKKEGEKVIYNL